MCVWGGSAVLSGFDFDALQEMLQYGDNICLVPDNVNGIVSYANSEDGRPWVQLLNSEVSVPPNLCDCHFRVQPAPHFVEQKKLLKMLKTSNWDEGKKLELPRVLVHNVDFELIAQDIIKKHKLNSSSQHALVDLLVQQRLFQEEQEGNKLECERVRGNDIRYGAALILVHVSTGKILTATKQRAIEASAKRAQLISDGVCICVSRCVCVCAYPHLISKHM